MLLRGSNGFDGPDSALAAISGADCETGVASGAAILAFAEAIMGSDEEKLACARNGVLDQLGEGVIFSGPTYIKKGVKYTKN